MTLATDLRSSPSFCLSSLGPLHISQQWSVTCKLDAAPVFCPSVEVLISPPVKLAVFEDAFAYRSGGACARDGQLHMLNPAVMLTSLSQQKSHCRRVRSTRDPVAGQVHAYILFNASPGTYNVEPMRARGALCSCLLLGHGCKICVSNPSIERGTHPAGKTPLLCAAEVDQHQVLYGQGSSHVLERANTCQRRR